MSFKEDPNEENLKRIAETICKEAFWGDYNYTAKDILEIISDPSREKERFFIFQKALFNLKEPWILTKIFSHKEIQTFLKQIRPNQKFAWLTERIKIWRNIFLGERNELLKTKWRFT